MVLEKSGEGQLYRSCEKWERLTYSQRGRECPTYGKRKADWMGDILHRKCLLKHITKEKRGRRHM